MYLIFIKGAPCNDDEFYSYASVMNYLNKYFKVNIYNKDHVRSLLQDKAGPSYKNVVVIDSGIGYVIRTNKYYDILIDGTFIARANDLFHAAIILSNHYKDVPGISFTHNKIGHLRQGRSAFSDTIKVDGPKKEKIKYSVSDDGELIKEILSEDSQ